MFDSEIPISTGVSPKNDDLPPATYPDPLGSATSMTFSNQHDARIAADMPTVTEGPVSGTRTSQHDRIIESGRQQARRQTVSHEG